MRVPRIELESADGETARLSRVAGQWRCSRIDVAESTATTHRVNLRRILPRLGDRPIASLTPNDVGELVEALHNLGLARESIRKTRATLAMVLDFGGIHPNPARDRRVKLPHEVRREVIPPSAGMS